MNLEDIISAPSSSTSMDATFLSWFLNVGTINFSMSRGGRLLIYENTNGYEVADYIATKV